MGEFSRTSTKIVVNGQTYRSIDEMPPDVRRQYDQVMSRMRADANQNGIPDIFEGKPTDGTSVAEFTTSVHEFVGDGAPPAVGLTPVSPKVRERAIARATEAMNLHEASGRRGVVVSLTWPTLIALLATAAVLGAAAAWYLK
jgi:hypothetical protein